MLAYIYQRRRHSAKVAPVFYVQHKMFHDYYDFVNNYTKRTNEGTRTRIHSRVSSVKRQLIYCQL